MHTRAGSILHNRDILTSWSMHAEVLPYSMCTKFGVDSSSRFSFRVRTHRHKVTDATDHLTNASTIASMGKTKFMLVISN